MASSTDGDEEREDSNEGGADEWEHKSDDYSDVEVSLPTDTIICRLAPFLSSFKRPLLSGMRHAAKQKDLNTRVRVPISLASSI